jgi:hypothetical protein
MGCDDFLPRKRTPAWQAVHSCRTGAKASVRARAKMVGRQRLELWTRGLKVRAAAIHPNHPQPNFPLISGTSVLLSSLVGLPLVGQDWAGCPEIVPKRQPRGQSLAALDYSPILGWRISSNRQRQRCRYHEDFVPPLDTTIGERADPKGAEGGWGPQNPGYAKPHAGPHAALGGRTQTYTQVRTRLRGAARRSARGYAGSHAGLDRPWGTTWSCPGRRSFPPPSGS